VVEISEIRENHLGIMRSRTGKDALRSSGKVSKRKDVLFKKTIPPIKRKDTATLGNRDRRKKGINF